MSTLKFETVDVFTQTQFGGNPLAVLFGGESLSTETMQKIASEFNLSEITFVLPPENAAHTARVRIFTPLTEFPFAGHPNVGTAVVVAKRGKIFGKTIGDTVMFEEKAGLVAIAIEREGDRPVGATLTAPEQFQWGQTMSTPAVAACLGLSSSDIRVENHEPRAASVGLPFLMVELVSKEVLAKMAPSTNDVARFCEAIDPVGLHCYVRVDQAVHGVDICARMFCEDGEDAATGSANGALMGVLADLNGPSDGTMTFRISQGAEMGRPSILEVGADRMGNTTTAIRVGGRCVDVMRGEIIVDECVVQEPLGKRTKT